MTQLFDPIEFELDDASDAEDAGIAGNGDTLAEDLNRPQRHLHSVPASSSRHQANATSTRTTQWRLDQETINTGRRGIARARAALAETRRTVRAA